MFCMNCGQAIPGTAQWCSACGTQVTVRLATVAPGRGAGAAAATAPGAAPISPSKHIGEDVKARSRGVKVIKQQAASEPALLGLLGAYKWQIKSPAADPLIVVQPSM